MPLRVSSENISTPYPRAKANLSPRIRYHQVLVGGNFVEVAMFSVLRSKRRCFDVEENLPLSVAKHQVLCLYSKGGALLRTAFSFFPLTLHFDLKK